MSDLQEMLNSTITPMTTIMLTEKEYVKVAKSHFEGDKDKLAEAINSGTFLLSKEVLVTKYEE